MMGVTLGIYEKALPPRLGWPEMLAIARDSRFDYVEMSVDESDQRQARLLWSAAERADFRRAVADSGIRVPSMCLSGHRKYPFGSADPAIRASAHDMMARAIDLAVDTGIRTIQLAGYDVYYEPSTLDSLSRFREGLAWSVDLASRAQVMLGMEIMDTPLMGTITRWLEFAADLPSPWFQVYPDMGNLSAWADDVVAELRAGAGRIVAVHLKDTKRPRPAGPGGQPAYPGQFRDLPFGQGEVNFPLVFRTLRETGYSGSYLIEMWTDKSPDPVAEIQAARAWILERMKEGGLEP